MLLPNPLFSAHRKNQLVGAVFEGIFDRKPTPADDLRPYRELLKESRPAEAVPRLVAAFLKSEHYQAHYRAQAVYRLLSTPAHRDIGGRPVSFIVPLGAHCLAARTLKDNGLKKTSLPFDWIFSTPDMVSHCLQDNFATFLNPRHYHSITNERANREPGAHHLFYLEKFGVHETFAHRDPTTDEDLAYFSRCVRRLNWILQQEAPKLFLIITRHHIDLAAQLEQLQDTLSGRTTNFVLLGIQLGGSPGDGNESHMKLLSAGARHRLYYFQPAVDETGHGFFPDKMDEWHVMRLIYSFKLSLSTVYEEA